MTRPSIRLQGPIDGSGGFANHGSLAAKKISDPSRREQIANEIGLSPDISVPLPPYKILTQARANRDRNFTPGGDTTLILEEQIMLDLAFVALGVAVIGLTGLYAVGLRQL